MPMNQALLGEFGGSHEMASTRKTLERVPDAKWDWKPHTRKSGSMGWQAESHRPLSGLAGGHVLIRITFDFAPGGKPMEQPSARNRQELLAIFDKGLVEARAALAKASDQELLATWTLLNNGQVFFSMPRIAAYRGMIMNHLIHHRAQLCVRVLPA